jgi:hypothetical protein
VFFLNCIRGNKDCPLVVPAEWNGCDIISQLFKDRVNPYQLSISVRQRHVLCFSGGEGNGFLCSRTP